MASGGFPVQIGGMASPRSRPFGRASGMALLVGLLVVTFAIAADLAHEAWATAQSQQRAAERAAREFVHLAATSTAYEAQATTNLALRTLFASVAARDDDAASVATVPGPEALARMEARIRDCRCAPALHPGYYFRLALAGGELRTAGDASPNESEARWLGDTIAIHARAARRADWDLALVFGDAGTRPRIVAYTLRGRAGGPGFAYGFVSDVATFGDAIVAPVAQRRGRGGAAIGARPALYDSLMRTLVIAPDGRAVYDANPRRPEQRVTMLPRAGHETYAPGVETVDPTVVLADTVFLGAQYGGLGVDVALMTSEPAAPFAGALPRSRLWVIFGLLVLMAGLVAAAVLQLRREHELARLRADLTAGVSHELRTPLAQIMLFGETLMLDRTRSERERRAAAEVIVREARRLMHLVENALHFARADRYVIELSPEVVDLAALARDVLVAFAPLAWAARVTIREEIEGEAPAFIDASAFRQIMLNLLENAVRYGPEGQSITVRVQRVERVVRLVVEDEGPGIAIADRERVWAPFVRLGGPQRSAGAGIGLAVVRDLAVRHGGRVAVDRADSGGARFVVELPARSPMTGKDSGHEDRDRPARAAL